MKLQYIEEHYNELLDKSEPITVCGWVLSVRGQKDINFVKLVDGSNVNGIQLILHNKLDFPSLGYSIEAIGKLVRSPAKEQAYELVVDSIKTLGTTDSSYPLAKTKLPLEYLRNISHLRMRTNSFGSIFRIKSAISYATHIFFNNKGFLHINPNIVTINECEGGAGVFQITENDITKIKSLPLPYDITTDHFGKPAYLTVSSQLQLEAIACSLGSVYTTNKSFRSEHSNTNKHLSEFEHLEIEDTFNNINSLMDIGEEYIKFVGNYIMDKNINDINNLGKFMSKGLKERIETIISTPFIRTTYSEAIKLLQTNQSKLSKPVVYGDDLCSEFENFLTEHYNAPVFVTHWPLSIKSFYMKRCDDGTCENFDLLMPYKIGELIGGSMREDNLDKMLMTMKEKGVSSEPLSFYLDLRRYGTVPHGGFGLGLDRMCMMFTGMESIKDVVAFPVYYKNCNY